MSAVMAPLHLLFWLFIFFVSAQYSRFDPYPVFSYSVATVALLSFALTFVLIIATIWLYRSLPGAVRLNRIYAWSQTIVCVVSIPLFFITSRAEMLIVMIPGILGALYPLSLFVSFRDE
jgi:hypothetical protein